MSHRLTFTSPRDVGALKAALNAELPAVFEALSGVPYVPETAEQARREYHSMEGGRDLPPNSPYADTASTRATAGDVRVDIRADVAWWNPREAANCSFRATLDAPGGSRLRIAGGRFQASTVEHLEVEVIGVSDERAGAVLWLLSRILDR